MSPLMTQKPTQQAQVFRYFICALDTPWMDICNLINVYMDKGGIGAAPWSCLLAFMEYSSKFTWIG